MSKFKPYDILVCPCGRYEGDGECPTCGKPATLTLHIGEEPSITPEQAKELVESMEPLLARAEKQDRWLHLVYFDVELPPAKVRALQRHGQYVKLVNWWSTVPRPNFTYHQGEWDTITLDDHLGSTPQGWAQ